MKRLFDHDPVTGTTEYYHYDSTDDSCYIETVQDVGDLVELNKAEYNQTDERARWNEGGTVARIPLWLYFDLKRRGVIDPEGNVRDNSKFLKWLDDRDNLVWRTRPGKVAS